MKIIMVAAVSKDEFLTNGDNSNVSGWTSAEDKEFFKTIKSKHHLYVMGSKTFDSGTVLPNSDTLKIVLTTTPERYSSQEVSGQIEFKHLTPKKFVTLYEPSNDTCLLLGGGYTYTQFLELNLVDEIYLTVEPLQFESGIPLLVNGKKMTSFINYIKPKTSLLNTSGTLLYHYVLKK